MAAVGKDYILAGCLAAADIASPVDTVVDIAAAPGTPVRMDWALPAVPDKAAHKRLLDTASRVERAARQQLR